MLDIRYPLHGWWEGKSVWHAIDLGMELELRLKILGIKVSMDWERLPERESHGKVDLTISRAIKINIKDAADGTIVKVGIFDDDENRDVFYAVWGGLVEEHYIYDVNIPRLAGAGMNPGFPLPWEQMPRAREKDKRCILFWCITEWEQGYLESLLSMPPNTLANKIRNMRNRYNVAPYNAGIPKGQNERDEFREKWNRYLDQAGMEEEKEKYKKMIDGLKSEDIIKKN